MRRPQLTLAVVCAFSLFGNTMAQGPETPSQEQLENPASTPSPPRVAQGKSAALLRISAPQFVEARNFSHELHPSAGIAGAVEVTRDNDNNRRLLQMIRERKVDLSELLVNDLKSAYANAQVDIVYCPDQFPKLAADKKSDDYSDVQIAQQRMLVVWFGVTGFATSGGLLWTPPLEPWVVVQARLVDAATKRILDQKQFVVGYRPKALLKQFEHVPMDPEYKFTSFEDLMKRSDVAIEALSRAVMLGAARIAAELPIE